MLSKARFLYVLIIVTVILSACAAPATTAPTQAPAPTSAPAATNPPAPTAAPTQAPAPTTAPTAAPTKAAATNTPAATATSAPKVVATISPDKLSQKGRLLICSDIPYPPQEFFDENGNPTGIDMDLGTEISNRLGLKVQFVNSVFDTIIAAVNGGKCDIIMSAMNITDTRKKQVSMIPYFVAGQALVVQKGNPKGINGKLDICGQSVAAESGTTNADWLAGANDYKDAGLPADCTKAGKKAPVLVVTQKDSDSLQQLQAGKVAAYATDLPVALYYTAQHPDQFQLGGQVIDPIQEGIVVPCGVADCSSAPLSDVGKAVETAFKSMVSDGTYLTILKKWGQAEAAIK
jgi:polar amino acid transport system substrate-binding protein